MRQIAFALAALIATLGAADAASLRVSPTALKLDPRSGATTVRVWNDDRQAINVQVRVFKSTMVNGKERLEATRSVVASPPMTQLRPGTENLVRVVRVPGMPVDASERFRLLVDEIPDPSRLRAGTVNVLVRHSIPVTIGGR